METTFKRRTFMTKAKIRKAIVTIALGFFLGGGYFGTGFNV